MPADFALRPQAKTVPSGHTQTLLRSVVPLKLWRFPKSGLPTLLLYAIYVVFMMMGVRDRIMYRSEQGGCL